jgi:positive regulator of sigma E activity
MACLLMSAALLYLVPPVEIWLHWNILNRAGYLGQWIVLGMVIYTGVLWLSGLRFRHMTLGS